MTFGFLSGTATFGFKMMFTHPVALFTGQPGEPVEASVPLWTKQKVPSRRVYTTSSIIIYTKSSISTLEPGSPGIPRAPSAPARPLNENKTLKSSANTDLIENMKSENLKGKFPHVPINSCFFLLPLSSVLLIFNKLV